MHHQFPVLQSITPSNMPGVYQMFDTRGKILYVGKAKNLKKRIASYAQIIQSDSKTRALLSKVSRMEVTITHNETEALLLECNLIKTHHPPYNILLRDDKSYPYLHLSSHHDFPYLRLHRGTHTGDGTYFGPYTTLSSMRHTMSQLQKIFQVRQCNDTYYKNRTRPCLQYQIKRCTAPCVGYITKEDYQESVNRLRLFLHGKNRQLITQLTQAMHKASQEQLFEKAAYYRDQIAHLHQLQEEQSVIGSGQDADVLAVAIAENTACIHVMSVRGGKVTSSRSYYPRMQLNNTPHDVLCAFIGQYYIGFRHIHIPPVVVLDRALLDRQYWEQAIMEHTGQRVRLQRGGHGARALLLRSVRKTAQQNLILHRNQRHAKRMQQLWHKAFGCPHTPERWECFDISHFAGDQTVASCVVFTREGPAKTEYKIFNITDVSSGDDCAALEQALTRHYKRRLKEAHLLPDVLLIDGGAAQFQRAARVLELLSISGVLLLGIKKGVHRRADEDTVFTVHGDYLDRHRHPAVMKWLQHMRDEAHRFALFRHRYKQRKKITRSTLLDIPGIGEIRCKKLLRHYGGLQGIMQADIQQLSATPSMNTHLAQSLYQALHS